MEKLTIEEKTEIVAALYNRIDSLKESIAAVKELGFSASNYEQSLSICENMIKHKKIWR